LLVAYDVIVKPALPQPSPTETSRDSRFVRADHVAERSAIRVSYPQDRVDVIRHDDERVDHDAFVVAGYRNQALLSGDPKR
jgi:hypothetical protein